MKCPNCNQDLPEGARFCLNCGEKLSFNEKKDSENHNRNQTNLDKKKKHIVRNTIFVLLCLGIIGGGGTLAYFYFGGDDIPTEDYYQEVTHDEIVYEQDDVYVDSQILITATDDVKISAIKRIVKKYGGEIVGYISVSNDYQIAFPDGKTYDELQEILAELNSNEIVESATLNLVFDGITSSVDYSNDPWQAKNAEAASDISNETVDWDVLDPDGSNWWAEVISIPLVWNLDFDTELETVNVGILDSMFDTTNEDLTESFVKLYQNPEDVNSLYTETYEAYIASEDEKEKNELYNEIKNIIHGTHVAGIIGAEANSFGITGISQNAELYGFSSFGEEEYEYISLMKWKFGIASLLEDDVRVINISMTYGEEISVSAQYDESQGLNAESSGAISTLDEISESMSLFLSKCLRQYDFLIVKSAGNENGYSWVLNENIDSENPYSLRKADSDDNSSAISIDFDSSYDFLAHISDETVKEHIIMVGAATLHTRTKTYCDESYFSARNADIYAPGMTILSDFPGNFTDYLSGTSMSAPMVTGVAAIIWGINPNLSAVEVKNILIKSTDYNTWGENIKIVDAWGSVALTLGTLDEQDMEESDFASSNSTLMGYAYVSGPDVEEGDIIAIPDVRIEIAVEGQEESVMFMDTEDDGTFTTLLPEGDYIISFSADGYNSVQEMVSITKGEPSFVTIPMTISATSAVWEVDEWYNEETGSYWGNGIITGYNDEGVRCWISETVAYELTGDFEPYMDFGMNSDEYFYYENNTVNSLNIFDGSLKWSVEIPLTGVTDVVFGDDGVLYVAGMYSSPNFFAINNKGEIIADLELYSDLSYYPHEMEYETGMVIVPMTSLFTNETIYIKIDTSDFSIIFDYVRVSSYNARTVNGKTYSMEWDDNSFAYNAYVTDNESGVKSLLLTCNSSELIVKDKYVYYASGTYERMEEYAIYSNVEIYRYSLTTGESTVVYSNVEESLMLSPFALIDDYLYVGFSTQYSGVYSTFISINLNTGESNHIEKNAGTIQEMSGSNLLLVSATGYPHGGPLYLMSLDGAEIVMLTEENVCEVDYDENYIYFTEITIAYDTRQVRCDIDGGNVQYLSQWISMSGDPIDYSYSNAVFSSYLHMEGKDCSELWDEDYEIYELYSIEGMYTAKCLAKTIEIDGQLWIIEHTYYTDIENTETVSYEENVIYNTTAIFVNNEEYEDDQILEIVCDMYSAYDYLDEEDDYISYQWDNVEDGEYNVELFKNVSSDYWELHFIQSLNDIIEDPAILADNINTVNSKEEMVNLIAFINLEDPEWQEEYNNISSFTLNVSNVVEQKRLSYDNALVALTNSYGFSVTTIISGLENYELQSNIYIFTAHIEGNYLYSDGDGEVLMDVSENCIAAVGYSDGWKIYALKLL